MYIKFPIYKHSQIRLDLALGTFTDAKKSQKWLTYLQVKIAYLQHLRVCTCVCLVSYSLHCIFVSQVLSN